MRLVTATKLFYCGDKDFHKSSPLQRFVAVMCHRNVLLQIVAQCVPTLSEKKSGNAGTIGPIFAVRELKATCKRTQQLPTLGQQCWKLLRSCWQWCANGRNSSQQCWDLQCNVERIQPARLCKPCVMRLRSPNNVGKSCANRSNIVALRFSDHGAKETLVVVGSKV